TIDPHPPLEYTLGQVAQGVMRVWPGARQAVLLELSPRLDGGDDGVGDTGYPSVSAVLAVRRGGEALREALAQLVQQDYPGDRYEVLVLLDGRRGGDEQIIRAIADQTNVPVRTIVADPPEGPAARNAAMRAATGAICAHTDDGCRIPNGWVRSIGAAFDETTSMLTGPVIEIRGSHPDFMVLPGTRLGWPEHELYPVFNVAYRRGLALAAGGFDESAVDGRARLPFAWDAELASRLRQLDWNGRYVKDMFLYRRYPPGAPGSRRNGSSPPSSPASSGGCRSCGPSSSRPGPSWQRARSSSTCSRSGSGPRRPAGAFAGCGWALRGLSSTSSTSTPGRRGSGGSQPESWPRWRAATWCGWVACSPARYGRDDWRCERRPRGRNARPHEAVQPTPRLARSVPRREREDRARPRRPRDPTRGDLRAPGAERGRQDDARQDPFDARAAVGRTGTRRRPRRHAAQPRSAAQDRHGLRRRADVLLAAIRAGKSALLRVAVPAAGPGGTPASGRADRPRRPGGRRRRADAPLLDRDEAACGHRPRPGQRPRDPFPRRADTRPRSAGRPRSPALRARARRGRPPGRARRDAHDGRGRGAVRPRRVPQPGPRPADRHDRRDPGCAADRGSARAGRRRRRLARVGTPPGCARRHVGAPGAARVRPAVRRPTCPAWVPRGAGRDTRDRRRGRRRLVERAARALARGDVRDRGQRSLGRRSANARG